MNLREYGTRLVDSAVVVDRFLAENPRDLAPDSRQRIAKALDYYRLARNAWDCKLKPAEGIEGRVTLDHPDVYYRVRDMLPELEEARAEYERKNPMKQYEDPDVSLKILLIYNSYEIDTVVQHAWKAARANMRLAERALASKAKASP